MCECVCVCVCECVCVCSDELGANVVLIIIISFHLIQLHKQHTNHTHMYHEESSWWQKMTWLSMAFDTPR